MRFVLRVAITAAALWLATRVVDGLEVLATGGPATVVLVHLGVALVLVAAHAVVKPLVKAVSFPLYLLTLGLFGLVVNALMLMLAGWLSEQTAYGLRVDGFWAAFWGALLVAVVTAVLTLVVPGAGDRRRHHDRQPDRRGDRERARR